MAGKGGQGPQSVAEGLGNVLGEITRTMQAPDAVRFQLPLLNLQGMVLQMIHPVPAQGGPPGGAPGGAPGGPGGAPPMGGPPGPRPMGGLMGGAPQGPSTAAGGGPPSSGSGMDPEMLRELVGRAAG
jgi:hypothetical protein